MEVIRLIVVTGSAIALASCGNLASELVVETKQGNSGQTFAQMCSTRASLNPEAKHTVEVLLQIAKTKECNAANQKLSSLTELHLEIAEISDIRPLQSLTNLTRLYLENNKISNIKPLQSLTKLTTLGLDNNKISDIKFLQSLTKLTLLGLSGNPITPKTCPIKPESICHWESLNNSYDSLGVIKVFRLLAVTGSVIRS